MHIKMELTKNILFKPSSPSHATKGSDTNVAWKGEIYGRV